MAYVSGIATISGSDLYTSTATPGDGIYPGQMVWDDKTGKAFRYVLNGGAAQVVGNLLQESAELTTYENMVVAAAAAAGATTLSITNGTSTITNAQFVGGTLSVYTAGTIAVGDEYTVINVTGTLTTGGALTVTIDRPLRAAVTTSATVNMRRAPFSGVIQMPQTTQTGMPVGTSIYPIALSEYGWIQTHGPCAMLSDNSTFAVGSMLSPSLAVAGAVGVNVAGTTHGTVGWARQAAASAKGIACFIMID